MIQILIVDDEKPICDLIQMSLTRAGYRCTCVETSSSLDSSMAA